MLNNNIQLGSVPALDLLPTGNELSRLLKSYMVACKVEGKSRSTLAIYSRVVSYFIRFTIDKGLPQKASGIKAGDVRLYLLHLQERGLLPPSVNAYYRALNTFFNWLAAEGFIKKSPMENIKPPRVPRKVVKPFSHRDIADMLLLCLGDTLLGLRNRAIMLTFLDTGLRLAELSAIQLQDLDFDTETIRVMGKGAKERVVRIGRTTQKALLRYILTRRDDFPCLWITEEGRPMSRGGVQTTIKRLCRRARIKGAKPGAHTFRHTAAINYLRNGGSEFTLQIMLGHSTLQMTRKYVSSLGQEDMIKAHRQASPVDNMRL